MAVDRVEGPEETVRRADVTVEELGTGTYPSLEDAGVATLPPLAAALSRIIQKRLDSGEYFVENGVVTRATGSLR
jgi:hypothetical protein